EQQSIDFVLYSMMPWFRRWEQAITRDLILAPQTFFAEFLIDGLLRGDTKSRYAAYASAITNGWMTRNEARIKENLNPLLGLDVPLAQANMTPVQSRAELQNHLSSIFIGVAGNIVRRELKSISKAIERYIDNIDALKCWAETFFIAHADYVAKGLAIDQATAEGYARGRLIQFLSPIEEGSVVDINQWERDSTQALLALNGKN
ncbi:MAG: phage portal protein, partial [Deltaproteobacteria bacterium]|nr:phage portal protein [Deltaproteobacteria bacterium]